MASVSQLPPDATYTQGDVKRRRRRKRRIKDGSMNRKLSAEQVKLLELSFGSDRRLEPERKNRLASGLGLDPAQVAVWFQNRRARWKTNKLVQDYSNLKSLHHDVVSRNCLLESQVAELRELVTEAEGEIRRLSASEVVGNSRSWSQSVDMTIHEQHYGNEGFDDVMYMWVHDNYVYDCDLWD